MVAEVISTSAWVVVVPRLVVNRNSRLSRITVIEAVSATCVVVAPIILRIGNIGIVIESIPVLRTLLAPSRAKRRLLLSLCCFGLAHDGESTDANCNDKKTTNHGVVLPSGSAKRTLRIGYDQRVLCLIGSAIRTIGIKRLFDNIVLRANACKLSCNQGRKV